MIINKMKFDDMRPLYDDVTLEVGLINGRHENPVDLYIFNGKDNPKEDVISDELMFDYDEQYHIIDEFITDHVEVEIGGESRFKDIVAYVSGLVCISASLINVCKDNGINLTLKHYNKSLTEKLGKDTYSDQVLIEDGENNIYKCLDEESTSTKDIFLDKGVNIFKWNRKSKLFYVNVLSSKYNEEEYDEEHTTKLYLFNKKTRAKAFYENVTSSITTKSSKQSESSVKYRIELGKAKMDEEGVFDFYDFDNVIREIDITYCE